MTGTTEITNDVWHHAAATYSVADGWKLYLDGNPETISCTTNNPPVAASCTPGVLPRSDTIQHAGLGVMLKSNGTPANTARFQGVIDEARVWDHVRTSGEIAAARDLELTSGSGLVARWGLNETSGTNVPDSIATTADGTITGTGYSWVPGFVPPTNAAPDAPSLNSPENADDQISTSPALDIEVSDPDGDALTVTFYGRPLASGNFSQIGQNTGVPSGTTDTTTTWLNLGSGQTYEWYATVSDGSLTTTGPVWTFHTIPSTDPVFVGVGDIATCDVTTDSATGDVIKGIDGTIFTTGDNVYPYGRASDFTNCYATTPWGDPDVLSRTYPIPGNHDWGDGTYHDLDGYFGYFGANANAGGTSYYSYDIDSHWHVVNLDSQCADVPGGCTAGSAQELWLKADLAANSTKNVIALWHKPRYSSGATNLQDLQPFWDDLYAAGVDILMDGHDHIYERFTPMKSGATLSSQPIADPTYGIQQFTVGMGGEEHHNFSGTILGTSLVRNNTDFGIFKLTLHPTSYDYVFLPIAGGTFTDSGMGTVHAAPPISADYYVDNTDVGCSDSGAGSLAVPFCTIGKAASLLTAGQTVRVLAGTYAETVNGPNSGTAGNPITYSAAPGVTVTGNGTASGNAFRMTSKSYIVIDGFTITDTVDYGIYAATSNHITISNNHVSSAGSPVSGSTRMGIFFTNTDDSTITGNTTDHNSQDGIRLTGGSAGNLVSDNVSFANAEEWQRNATGIQVTGAGSDNNTLIHNITYANEDSGLQFYSGAQNNFAIGNLTYGNGDHGIDNNAAPGNTIVGNTVQGNVTAGINLEGASSPGSGGATLANNIAVDNGLRLQVGGGTASGQATNIRVDAQSITGTTLDYDLVDLSTGTGMIQWNGTTYSSLAAFKIAVPTQEVHGLEADPLFAAPAAIAQRPASAPFIVAVNVGDYHLTAGSPAIDSANSDASNEPTLDIEGQTRVDDPATANTGAGIRTYDDRGAYEYVPTAPVAYTLSGTLTGAGDVPLPDGIVHVVTDTWTYIGSSPITAGHYSFSLPSGNYKLYIEPNDPAYADQWYDGAASFAAGTTINLTTDQTNRDIVLTPIPVAYTLSGTLTGAGDVPLPDGIVHVVTDTWTYIGSSPITAGHYSFSLPSGNYKLYIEPNDPAYADQWYDGAASFAAGTTINLTTDQTNRDIVLTPIPVAYTLSGTLTGAGDVPLPDGIVHVVTDTWTYIGSSPITAGHYSFSLPSGNYKLYIEPNDPAYADQWYDGAASFAAGTTINLTTDQTNRDIVLTPIPVAYTLSGTLTGAGDVPLPDGIVHVVTDTWTYIGSSPITAGHYSFSLPSGNYKLYIEPNDPAYADQWYDGAASFAAGTTINLTTDQTNRDIVLTPIP